MFSGSEAYRKTNNKPINTSSRFGEEQTNKGIDTAIYQYQRKKEKQGKYNQVNHIEPVRSFLNFRGQQLKTSQKVRSTRGSSHGLSEYQNNQPQARLLGSFTQYIQDNKNLIRQEISIPRPNIPLTARQKIPQSNLFQQGIYTQRKKETQLQRNLSITQTIQKNNFEILCPVGKGGFGKVWKVSSKKNKQIFAMKQMYKAKIIQKKSINSVMNERILLAKVRHPFLINMSYAFQDRQNLYLIMDYINGGDLRYHLGKYRKFSQEQARFFIANIFIGLEYLHSNKIIHRDIKPQNLVLGSDGYLRITDLGISREWREQNYQDTSGTPGYMSPQVICRKNHSYQVDYFAVGVIGYEFMIGKRPYNGRNRKEIRQAILAKQAGIKVDQLPKNWSVQSADFINRLLNRTPSNRLGYQGFTQIKNHPWMKNINWSKLYRKQIKAPYIPMSIQQDYDDYKKQISEDTIPDNIQQNMLMLRDNSVQNLFEGYQFNGKQIKSRKTPVTNDNQLSSRLEIKRF